MFDVSLEEDPWRAMKDIVAREMERPCALTDRRLFSYSLIRMAPDRFVWHQRYHHILVDGFSYSLIARRVSEIYSLLAAGRVPPDFCFRPIVELLDVYQRGVRTPIGAGSRAISS